MAEKLGTVGEYVYLFTLDKLLQPVVLDRWPSWCASAIEALSNTTVLTFMEVCSTLMRVPLQWMEAYLSTRRSVEHRTRALWMMGYSTLMFMHQTTTSEEVSSASTQLEMMEECYSLDE